MIRARLLDYPEPNQRRHNINVTVRSVCATCYRSVDAGKSQGEANKRNSAWQHPERAFPEPQPRPKREATGNRPARQARTRAAKSLSGFQDGRGSAATFWEFNTLALHNSSRYPTHGLEPCDLFIKFLLLALRDLLPPTRRFTPVPKPCSN